MTKIIVMLVWVGSHFGGPAAIQGFDSLEACQRSIPEVIQSYKEIAPEYVQIPGRAKCVILNK